MTERTVIARKVQGNRRYREAQSKLVVHTTNHEQISGCVCSMEWNRKIKPRVITHAVVRLHSFNSLPHDHPHDI